MSRELQARNTQNKLTLWAGRISECRSSGQKVKDWCWENGICEQTYYKWQKRLFEMVQAQQAVQFAEVTPVQAVRSGKVAVTVRMTGAEADIHSGGCIRTIVNLGLNSGNPDRDSYAAGWLNIRCWCNFCIGRLPNRLLLFRQRLK